MDVGAADTARLLRQQEQTQALLDVTDALVFVKDTALRYLQVNEGFSARVGRTPAACVGLTDFDLFPRAMAEQYRRNDLALLESGDRQERLVEVPARPGQQGPRLFRSAKSVLRDEHGQVWGLAGVGTDLTDEVRAREQLEARGAELAAARDAAVAATRAKSAFLATVSHELRTPLHGVLGVLELLVLDARDDAQRECAEIGLGAGRVLLSLLNDVLDLSRGEAPEVALRRVPVDGVVALRTAAAAVAAGALTKGLALRVDTPAGAPAVLADPDRLQQVLLNLAGNAVKFTAEGEVVLRLRPDGDRVVLEVSDTGPGVSDEDLPRLFAAFEQGAAGRAHGGSGLGLALVDQMVRLMDGTLEVTTSSGGSVFAVSLPVAAGVSAPEPRDGAHDDVLPARRPGGPLRVLLVDDSAVNRTIGAAQLEHLGAVAVLAEDGPAGLAAFDDTVDLVLLDLQMPGMDGLEVARALRATPHGRAVPIVALTASGDGVRDDCLQAGMDDVAAKPLSMTALADLLAAHAR